MALRIRLRGLSLVLDLFTWTGGSLKLGTAWIVHGNCDFPASLMLCNGAQARLVVHFRDFWHMHHSMKYASGNCRVSQLLQGFTSYHVCYILR